MLYWPETEGGLGDFSQTADVQYEVRGYIIPEGRGGGSEPHERDLPGLNAT